jgi:hypothetical protein
MSENRAETTYSFKKEMTEIEWLLRIFDPESPQDALLSYARFFEQTLTEPHSESRPQIHSEFTTDSGLKSAVSYFRHADEAYVSKLKISWMEPASTQHTRNSNEIFAEEVWRLGEVNVNASYSREFAAAGSFRRIAFGKVTLTSEFIKVHRQRLEEIVKESLDGPIFFPVSRESIYWQPQRRDELLARMKSEVGALLGHQIDTHRSWNAAIPSYPQNPLPGKGNPGDNKSVKDVERRSKGQRPKSNPLEIFKTQVDACAEALKVMRKSEIEIVFMSPAELAAHLEQVESIYAEAARLYKNALGMGSSMAHIEAVNNAFANFRESVIRYK